MMPEASLTLHLYFLLRPLRGVGIVRGSEGKLAGQPHHPCFHRDENGDKISDTNAQFYLLREIMSLSPRSLLRDGRKIQCKVSSR